MKIVKEYINEAISVAKNNYPFKIENKEDRYEFYLWDKDKRIYEYFKNRGTIYFAFSTKVGVAKDLKEAKEIILKDFKKRKEYHQKTNNITEGISLAKALDYDVYVGEYFEEEYYNEKLEREEIRDFERETGLITKTRGDLSDSMFDIEYDIRLSNGDLIVYKLQKSKKPGGSEYYVKINNKEVNMDEDYWYGSVAGSLLNFYKNEILQKVNEGIGLAKRDFILIKDLNDVNHKIKEKINGYKILYRNNIKEVFNKSMISNSITHILPIDDYEIIDCNNSWFLLRVKNSSKYSYLVGAEDLEYHKINCQ